MDVYTKNQEVVRVYISDTEAAEVVMALDALSRQASERAGEVRQMLNQGWGPEVWEEETAAGLQAEVAAGELLDDEYCRYNTAITAGKRLFKGDAARSVYAGYLGGMGLIVAEKHKGSPTAASHAVDEFMSGIQYHRDAKYHFPTTDVKVPPPAATQDETLQAVLHNLQGAVSDITLSVAHLEGAIDILTEAEVRDVSHGVAEVILSAAEVLAWLANATYNLRTYHQQVSPEAASP